MSQAFYDSLTTSQQKIVDLYKSNGPHKEEQCFANALNCMLGNDNVTPGWLEEIAILDDVIAKKKLESSKTVYRVMSNSFFLTENLAIGDSFTYPSYMSTGKSLASVITHFATVHPEQEIALLIINCPMNTCIAPLENDTTSETEEELLLGRGTKFTISNLIEITDRTDIIQIAEPDAAEYITKIIKYELSINI